MVLHDLREIKVKYCLLPSGKILYKLANPAHGLLSMQKRTRREGLRLGEINKIDNCNKDD